MLEILPPGSCYNGQSFRDSVVSTYEGIFCESGSVPEVESETNPLTRKPYHGEEPCKGIAWLLERASAGHFTIPLNFDQDEFFSCEVPSKHRRDQKANSIDKCRHPTKVVHVKYFMGYDFSRPRVPMRVERHQVRGRFHDFASRSQGTIDLATLQSQYGTHRCFAGGSQPPSSERSDVFGVSHEE